MPYPIYYPSLCLFYLFIYIHPTFPLIFWGGFQPTNNSFIVAKQMLMQHHIHMERQMLSHKPREQGQLCCLGLNDCGHSCLEQCSSSDHAARICWCWANTSYYREYTEPYSNRKTLYQQWTLSRKKNYITLFTIQRYKQHSCTVVSLATRVFDSNLNLL